MADKTEKQLFERLMSYRDDPYTFTRYSFRERDLPFFEDWQADVLKNIAEPGLYSIKSGHGVGKSALAVWIVRWFLSTRNRPAVICTSNTATQLSSKLWREMSIWQDFAINRHWFEWTATKLALKANPSSHFAEAVTWNEQKPEAFAGTHAKDVLFLFDEASVIPSIIWETTMGALTTGRCHFIVMGNPTARGTEFEKTFGSSKWKSWSVDSRTCKRMNHSFLDNMIKEYGIDSDIVKVRILGEFPDKSVQQLIGGSSVSEATSRVIMPADIEDDARIIGADIAGFGGNKSVFCCRQGSCAFDFDCYAKRDTMFLTGALATKADRYDPDMIFVDYGGIGQGVCDRLRELGYPVQGIMFGAKTHEKIYGNKRIMMWDKTREWLETGGSIPPIKELHSQLTKPDFFYRSSGELMLESKATIAGDLDYADALALTFAAPVVSRGGKLRLRFSNNKKKDWDPLK